MGRIEFWQSRCSPCAGIHFILAGIKRLPSAYGVHSFRGAQPDKCVCVCVRSGNLNSEAAVVPPKQYVHEVFLFQRVC
jgi:hypothetical protein